MKKFKYTKFGKWLYSLKKKKEKIKWVQYYIRIKKIDDYRPLIFNPSYPWWNTHENDEYIFITCWLPKKENIFKYWDNAFVLDFKIFDNIKFDEYYYKPDYYKPL